MSGCVTVCLCFAAEDGTIGWRRGIVERSSVIFLFPIILGTRLKVAVLKAYGDGVVACFLFCDVPG